jgi:flagellar motor switch protein FliN/FliY
MTDTNELLRSLAGQWSDLLAQIVQSMTDQKPKANWRELSGPNKAGDIFWWEQHLSLGDGRFIWVGAPEQAWKEIGRRTLRASGIETVEDADARNTYLEILSQSLSGLAQSIGSRMGREVTCGEGKPGESAPQDGRWAAVEVVYEDLGLPAMLLGFSPRLMETMANPNEADSKELMPPAEQALERAGPAGEPQGLLPQNSKTLNLLLDVELPVSVSFGRAELMLKDVLKLTTGSIVELNRGVTEPVEVIVNNCVVARGEVVVMDGNYGVRIDQIISPQERLRTLK